MKVKDYFVRIAISLDQFVNTVFGGDEDETISSRLGKWQRDQVGTSRRKFAYIVCMMLNKLDKNHCQDAIEDDEGK